MTTRWPSTVGGSEGAVLANIADQAVRANLGAYNTGTGSATLTAAKLVNGIYNITGGTTATLTCDTATNICAAIPNAQIGSTFWFHLYNGGSGAATIAADAGPTVTLVGTAAVPTVCGQMWHGIVTAIDTPAVTLCALLKTAS